MDQDTKTVIVSFLFVLALGLAIVAGLFLIDTYTSSKPTYTVTFEAGGFDYRVDRQSIYDDPVMRFNGTTLVVPSGERLNLNAYTNDWWTIRGYIINGEEVASKRIQITVTENLTISQLPPVRTIYKAALDLLYDYNLIPVESGEVRGYFETTIQLGLLEFILVATDFDRNIIHHYRGHHSGIEKDYHWESWDYFFFLDGKVVYYAKLPLGVAQQCIPVCSEQ